MSSRFEFKLKKNKETNLNLNNISNDLKKITMKFIGLYGNSKTKFSSKVVIELDNKNKNLIKSVNIEELEVNESCDHHSDYVFQNVYTLCEYSTYSSSSCSSVSSKDVYDEVMKFLKGIKLITNNNKLSGITFSLKNSQIKKIKVKGKLN